MNNLSASAAIALALSSSALAVAGEAAPPPPPELAKTVAAFIGKSVYDSTITMPGGKPHEDQADLRLQEDRSGQGGDLPVDRQHSWRRPLRGRLPDGLRHPRQDRALHGHHLRRGGARPRLPLERRRAALRSAQGRHGGTGGRRRAVVLVRGRASGRSSRPSPLPTAARPPSRAWRRSRAVPVPSSSFSQAMRLVLNHAMLALAVSLGRRTGLFETMAKLPPSTDARIASAAGLDRTVCAASGWGRWSPVESWTTTGRTAPTCCPRSTRPC